MHASNVINSLLLSYAFYYTFPDLYASLNIILFINCITYKVLSRGSAGLMWSVSLSDNIYKKEW
jgi:hypothetical protein